MLLQISTNSLNLVTLMSLLLPTFYNTSFSKLSEQQLCQTYPLNNTKSSIFNPYPLTILVLCKLIISTHSLSLLKPFLTLTIFAVFFNCASQTLLNQMHLVGFSLIFWMYNYSLLNLFLIIEVITLWVVSELIKSYIIWNKAKLQGLLFFSCINFFASVFFLSHTYIHVFTIYQEHVLSKSFILLQLFLLIKLFFGIWLLANEYVYKMFKKDIFLTYLFFSIFIVLLPLTFYILQNNVDMSFLFFLNLFGTLCFIGSRLTVSVNFSSFLVYSSFIFVFWAYFLIVL